MIKRLFFRYLNNAFISTIELNSGSYYFENYYYLSLAMQNKCTIILQIFNILSKKRRHFSKFNNKSFEIFFY